MKIKKITVKGNTLLRDLKPGDLVITAEIHKVVKAERRDFIRVVDFKPACIARCKDNCGHESVKELGWGQHSLAKILKLEKVN